MRSVYTSSWLAITTHLSVPQATDFTAGKSHFKEPPTVGPAPVERPIRMKPRALPPQRIILRPEAEKQKDDGRHRSGLDGLSFEGLRARRIVLLLAFHVSLIFVDSSERDLENFAELMEEVMAESDPELKAGMGAPAAVDDKLPEVLVFAKLAASEEDSVSKGSELMWRAAKEDSGSCSWSLGDDDCSDR
jgi:hypothetical protein